MFEESLKEKLSALLDGELEPVESIKLLRRIEGEPDLKTIWSRYSLTSEAMRSKRVLVPDGGFVDRISATLADEPTVLAPRAERKSHRAVREKVVTAALAASLALVAVVVGKSLKDYSPIRGSELLARAELVRPSAQTRVDSDFRDLLAMHHETAYLSGAQGMLPSVRLVSTDPMH
jgi:sigma-E factor negative regulatory protein RseA